MGVLKIRSCSGDPAQVKPMAWITTFNDLMTLLMVFFVLLFSMGSMDLNRFRNFQNGLQSAMGVFDQGGHASHGVISDQQGHVADTADTDDAPAVEAVEQETLPDYRALAGTRGLAAEYTARGLLLTLDDELLFPSGSARLTGEGMKMLAKVSAAIKPMGRAIRVEGHTDDRPIATVRYPSNWELSIARAISVIDFFVTQGGVPADRLSAVGYGSAKPRVPNDSEHNRRMNRRVEIILGQTDPTTAGTGSIEGE